MTKIDPSSPCSLVGLAADGTFVIDQSPVEFVLVGDVAGVERKTPIGRRDRILVRSSICPVDLVGYVALQRLGEAGSGEVVRRIDIDADHVISFAGKALGFSERGEKTRIVRWVAATISEVDRQHLQNQGVFSFLRDSRNSDLQLYWIAPSLKDPSDEVTEQLRAVAVGVCHALAKCEIEELLWLLAPVLATCRKEFLEEQDLRNRARRRRSLVVQVIMSYIALAMVLGIVAFYSKFLSK